MEDHGGLTNRPEGLGILGRGGGEIAGSHPRTTKRPFTLFSPSSVMNDLGWITIFLSSNLLIAVAASYP